MVATAVCRLCMAARIDLESPLSCATHTAARVCRESFAVAAASSLSMTSMRTTSCSMTWSEVSWVTTIGRDVSHASASVSSGGSEAARRTSSWRKRISMACALPQCAWSPLCMFCACF